METLADRIDAGLTKLVDHLDNSREHSDRSLAASFATVAEQLLDRSRYQRYTRGSPGSHSSSGTIVTGGETLGAVTTAGTSVTSPMSRVDGDASPESAQLDRNQEALASRPEDHKYYRMVKRHLSLEDMWDEWHGTGRFSDEVGGIQGRNKLFGPKWRKHLNMQHYSRTKFVVTAVSNFAKNNKLKITEAIAIMDNWWKEKPVCTSLTKMKALCGAKGLVKKGKMRGRQCKRQQEEVDDDDDDNDMDVEQQ